MIKELQCQFIFMIDNNVNVWRLHVLSVKIIVNANLSQVKYKVGK